MSDDRRKKYLQLLLTAALTLFVYVLLFAIRGFWPLGRGSVLITDLYSQYTPLLYRFYDVVTGVKNPFMEFGLAAGTPLFADTANELINPFNYVLLLFGRERIYLAQNLLIVLYGVAAAVSAQLCLRYFFACPAGLSGTGGAGAAAAGVAAAGAFGAGDAGRQQESARIGRMHVIEAALCVSYAVSGYAAYNYQIIKWMIFPVLFPLFVMALHRLLSGGKAFWYTLLLAYQLMLSVQLGIMTLLFTLFATVFYLHWRHGGVMLSRLGLATLCGILLSAPVFLPAVYTLFTSARAGEIANYTNIMRRHGLDDIADRLFQIAHPALLSMLAAALIAWRRQRGKAATSLIKHLLAWNIFLWFTVLFEPANLLWHLGSYICFPVRYAYMSLFSVAVTVRYLLRKTDADEDLEAAAPGRRPTIVILAVTACAFAAAALLVTLRHELPITQVFSSLVITAYPRVLLYVVLAMALLFAAGLCATMLFASGVRATLPASSRRGGVMTAVMLPVTCIATSLALQLFVFLPESYGIRGANQEAYERMIETTVDGGAAPTKAVPDDNPFALAAYDETLPRNAALVNRTHTITSYLPAVPKKTQELLSSLGFDTYWMATYDTGGTEEARALLAHAYLMNASGEAGADVSVNEDSGLVTAQLTDAKEGDVLHLPLIAHDGWRVTIRSTGTQVRTYDVAALSPEGLMTIPLHAGDSEIILRFTPPYLRLGCVLFAVGLLLLFLLRISAESAAAPGRRLTAPVSRQKTEHLCRMLYMLLLGAAFLGIYLIPLAGQAYYTVKEVITGKEEETVFDTPAHALLNATETADGILVEMTGQNLVRARAVTVSADSMETENFPATLVRDGDDESQTSRWSSANDRDNCDHWLRLDFPEEEEIALLRVTWERDNMTRYAVETSEDGESWTEVLGFDTAPEEPVQDIRFPEAVRTKHLRLHFTDVRREEEDGTLYYQNVSVLELEAYDAASQEQFLIETPVIPAGTERVLQTPSVPEGYALQFAGADYEMLIDAEGNIRDTLSDVPVEIGYTLSYEGGQEALPGMHLTIPASEADAAGVALPAGIEVMECAAWISGQDASPVAPEGEKGARLRQNEEIFAEELAALGDDARRVRLLLTEEDDPRVAGAEGFQLEIGGPAHPEEIVIYAQTVAGLRWGEVTLLELMEETEGELPACVIRDYPRYSVRGFGVDVARRMVPMEWLYRVVEELSRHKMNTLHLHLNDNHIVAEHSYDGTLQGAYDLYAGFRLESSIKNEQGEGITSTDLYYTDEEFKALVQYAASLGVTIVPEIDTPAHSLAFIRVFPELGVKRITDMADTLDLSSEEAKRFAKDLWSEYLSGEDALFADCPVLHLGMDEYFGEGEVYLSYLKDMSAYVASLAPEKELRVWGSLDWYEDLPYDLPEDLTMQVWSPEWCDVRRAFARGHGIINSLSHQLYIIPGTGQELQELAAGEAAWSPNVFENGRNTFTIPAYSPQMKGACYMLWNDHSGEGGNLREEYDDESLFELFRAPLPAIAEELW